MAQSSFGGERWTCMRARKTLWLLSLVAVLLLVGLRITLAQGPAVAPFLYTPF